MPNLYFLGGIPPSATEEVEDYIYSDLNVEDLENIWLDPRHECRAVFLSTSELDLKKLQEKVKKLPLGENELFLVKEEETSELYVHVPKMKCKGLIDKLPWLFHQRAKGGSKVSDIKKVSDEELDFVLTFKDGWGAVLKVSDKSWSVENTEVSVTPYFACFQRNYHEQKNLYLQKPKGLVKCSEPKEITMSMDTYFLILCRWLSLETKCNETYPAVTISIVLESEKLHIKGPISIVDKLKDMIKNQMAVFEKIHQDFGLELFLKEQHHHQAIMEIFQNKQIHIALETKGNNIELFVMKEEQKMTFSQLLQSVSSLVKEFDYIINETNKDFKDELMKYVENFNLEKLYFKLEASEENKWHLYKFGYSVSENMSSSIVEKIQKFLTKHTEPPKSMNRSATNSNSRKFGSEKPKPAVPQKTENMSMQPKYLLALFDCLSLKEKIEEHFQMAKITISAEHDSISITSQPTVLGKLKKMLFSLYDDIHSKESFPDEFEMFLAEEKDQIAVKEYFQSCSIFLKIEETSSKDITLKVQGIDGKIINFQDFTAQVLKRVKLFKMASVGENMKEFQDEFNRDETFYKLQAIGNDWQLFQLGFNDEKLSNILGRIKEFQDESGESDGDDLFEDAIGDSNNEQTNGKTAAKKTNDDGMTSATLTEEQQKFFSENNDMLPEMRKKLASKVSKIQHIDKVLLYTMKSTVSDAFNAVNEFLLQIKSHTIDLPFPGVAEFFETKEGLKLLKKAEKQFKCVISPKDRLDLKPSNKTEVKILGTLLESTVLYNRLHFHVFQGDGRNVKADVSLFIKPGVPNFNFWKRGNAELSLPEWLVKTETSKDREAKVTGMRDMCENVFMNMKQTNPRSISISVSSKFQMPFPNSILAEIIIDRITKVFSSVTDYLHIFFCESKSTSILKAFQYELTSCYHGEQSATTQFSRPQDNILEQLPDLAYVSQKSSPQYPDDVKIEVSRQISDTPNGKSLICLPVKSPMTMDKGKCPVKFSSLLYGNVLRSIEKDKEDGLFAGEVYISDTVAIYGCQDWDVNVNKVIGITLENCLAAAKNSDFESVQIVVPGTALPYLYPKEWLVSKWFEHLDNYIKMKENIKSTIHFVISDQELCKKFEEHVNLRKPKSFMSKWWTNSDRKTGPDATKDKYEAASCEVEVILHGTNQLKNVTEYLKKQMKDLMKKHTSELELTLYEEKRFRKIIEDKPTVFWKITSSAVRGKSSKLRLQALAYQFVDDVIDSIRTRSGSQVQKDSMQGIPYNNRNQPGRQIQQSSMQGTSLDNNRNQSGNQQSGATKQRTPSVSVNDEAEESGEEETMETDSPEDDSPEDDKARDSLKPVDDFEWSYCDKTDSKFFSDEEHSKLETAYRNGEMIFKCDVSRITVDFTSMSANKVDDSHITLGVIRNETVAVRHCAMPGDWGSDGCKKLKSANDDYKNIERDLGRQGDLYNIVKVERIQKQILWDKYQKMKKATGDPSNEKIMWQRICGDFKEFILNRGCHKFLCEVKCNELGDGICFASNIADCIPTHAGHGQKILLIRCNVCLGAVGEKQGHRHLRYPPINSKTNEPFSSVSNEKFSMVFNPNLVYPTHFVLLESDEN